MALKGWTVKLVKRADISDFIEQHHYSGSINGCIADYCYALYDNNGSMAGGLFFGRMAMRNQYKRFSENEKNVIELRRLCCVDDTPKNTESFFIGAALRLLRKHWQEEVDLFSPSANKRSRIVVSYADKEYGHTGIVYKASNFEMIGEVEGAKVIIYNGKRYHDKAIRTKYKGNLKPFSVKIKKALEEGKAEYKKTAGKFTYIYRLD